MGEILLLESWEYDTGKLYLPEPNPMRISHPLERLYKIAGAIIRMPIGEIDKTFNEKDGKGLSVKKFVPHSVLEGTELFVRTHFNPDGQLNDSPGSLVCGVNQHDIGPMHINIERRELRLKKKPMEFEKYLAGFFDSHLEGLGQQRET